MKVTNKKGYSLTMREVGESDSMFEILRDNLDNMDIPMIIVPLRTSRTQSTMDPFDLYEFVESLGVLSAKDHQWILDMAVYYSHDHQHYNKGETVKGLEEDGMFIPEVGSRHFIVEVESFINDLFSRDVELDMGSSFQEAESFVEMIRVLSEKYNVPFSTNQVKGYSQGEEWILASWMNNKTLNKNFCGDIEEANNFLEKEVDNFASMMVGEVYDCELKDHDGDILSEGTVFGYKTEKEMKELLEEWIRRSL